MLSALNTVDQVKWQGMIPKAALHVGSWKYSQRKWYLGKKLEHWKRPGWQRWGKSIPGRGNLKYESPEAGT